MKDEMEAGVNLRVDVLSHEGRLLQRQQVHNLVVTAGKNLIRDHLYGDSVAGLTHFAVGSGTAIPLVTDVVLQTEVFIDTLTSKTKDVGKLTCAYYLGTSSANGYTLSEAGLFNAADEGAMYARAIYTGIQKTALIAVNYTWEVTWS